jgi:1-pyrroline-5-carboxylate dehydrogenase
LFQRLATLAKRRNLKDLTVGPVLTVTNERFQSHLASILKIPKAQLLFGGDLLTDHNIPACYGSWEPTAVQVPIEELLKSEYYKICTTEIFGGFQVVVTYCDVQLPLLLEPLERTHAHLTAAVVSNDVNFQRKVCNTILHYS